MHNTEWTGHKARVSPWLRMLHRVPLSPRATLLAVDAWLVAVSFALAFLLRFDFSVPTHYRETLLAFLLVLVPIKLALFGLFGLHRGVFRYLGVPDMIRVVEAQAVAALAVALAGQVLAATLLAYRVPHSVVVMDFFISTALVGGVRFGGRVMREMFGASRSARRTALIAGAGDAGLMAVKALKTGGEEDYRPIGFVDDDLGKRGRTVEGLPILGALSEVPRLVSELRIDEVILAMPSAPGSVHRKLVESCSRLPVRFKTVPSLRDAITGTPWENRIKEVSAEDLLRREPVQLHLESIRATITQRSVLVTGAGGSIGSELCRQLAALEPERIVMLERYENGLYSIEQELTHRWPEARTTPVIGDVADSALLDRLFKTHSPHLVFHAAAHKHVPLMEQNPVEAARNNVLGTSILAGAAQRAGVEKFVFISTDKAVNPTSVMGATKRFTEKLLRVYEHLDGTRFVTVRFGNVLGSSGSVIPLFQQQIARGGPVTVTHEDATRYFMTIPEAVQLVLQAGSFGDRGDIFILDMGKPVRIVELARNMIALAGKQAQREIEIRFVGLRPGEKLVEELVCEDETLAGTTHPQIRVAHSPDPARDRILAALERLEQAVRGQSEPELMATLEWALPEYTSRPASKHMVEP